MLDESNQGLNIKFVEKGGYSVQNLLEESDPFRPPTCGRERCQPCAAAGGRNSKCDSKGGAYEIVCKECEEIKAAYYGQTGRKCYRRGLDHWEGYQRGSRDNPLWKHASKEHEGRKDVEFEMNVVGTYGKDNLKMCVNEAVRIEGAEGVILNSRAEFNQPLLPRARIQRNTLGGQ